MGEIVQMRCEACGFQKEIFVGGGMQDWSPETILEALPDEGKQVLEKAVRDGARQISITRRPYSCPSCKTVYALPVVDYVLNGRKTELYGICPECGSAGGSAEDGAAILCPGCGKELISRHAGNWD